MGRTGDSFTCCSPLGDGTVERTELFPSFAVSRRWVMRPRAPTLPSTAKSTKQNPNVIDLLTRGRSAYVSFNENLYGCTNTVFFSVRTFRGGTFTSLTFNMVVDHMVLIAQF